MMAKARVTLNRRGMRDLLVDPGVSADLMRRAERVAAAARGSAPTDSGDYKNSIIPRVVEHGDRSVGQVHATVDYALVVESRTGNLARALDAGLG
jgi:hypothetical protein